MESKNEPKKPAKANAYSIPMEISDPSVTRADTLLYGYVSAGRMSFKFAQYIIKTGSKHCETYFPYCVSLYFITKYFRRIFPDKA
ncbi:hypothetical protein AGMMS49975_00700 [Clostridia bacterium]|nr:hypothetical protein AGMMS49975_00700 [Clostridia bacterium]